MCTCHNSAFSIVDGSVKSPPATQALPAVALKIDGENISVA
jgi:Rieske Fe-S protein